ncbi:type 1 glutamine amidotransferase family protein [Pectinatus frisingensis]|uniref:hypothetical protein n=1 Tax=Pectinatus frisingensis TaxID=865 RepID=UPI0015F4DB38|nr:hypothetical protein [Pectinatus frisingensis]
MISTSAVLLRRLTLFDDTLKNLRSGLDKGPIIISHTGNSLSHLKEKAPKYNGEWLFKEKQAIYDNNIITANGTAPLEFVREILLALNMFGGKNKVDEWYNLYKQGTFQS